MKKLLAKIALVAMAVAPFAMPFTANAAALPNWDLTGTWTFDDIWMGGHYLHTMNITSFDPSTGVFSGTGFYNDNPALTWTVTGTESGNSITMFNLLVTAVAPGVTIMGSGTINPSGTLITGQGVQSNLPDGGAVDWTAAGTAHPITYVSKVGPITSGSQDGSSCGGVWANDTYSLFFAVTANGDGTYGVQTFYKNGSFTTIAGQSPGACSNANHHGSTIKVGVVGKFQGFVKETVTASSFDPSICGTAGSCMGRGDFVSQVFGTPSEDKFSWNFEYNSSDKSLSYKHWQDKSDNDGIDKFEGDIANN